MNSFTEVIFETGKERSNSFLDMVDKKSYLEKSTKGNSTKYNILYIYFILNIFSNSKKCILCLLKVVAFE